VNDADLKIVEPLGVQLSRILGTGIIFEAVDLGEDEASPAHIRAVGLIDGRPEMLEVRAANRKEAFDRLAEVAADLRLARASRNMISPI